MSALGDWCRARGHMLARRDDETFWLLRERWPSDLATAPMGTPGVLTLYALASEIDDVAAAILDRYGIIRAPGESEAGYRQRILMAASGGRG